MFKFAARSLPRSATVIKSLVPSSTRSIATGAIGSSFKIIPSAFTNKNLNFINNPNSQLTFLRRNYSSLTEVDVSKRVYDVIKGFKKAQSTEITDDLNFSLDLGFDSLDIVEVLVAVEEEFDFEIPDADADEIKTVGQIIDYIVKHPEAT